MRSGVLGDHRTVGCRADTSQCGDECRSFEVIAATTVTQTAYGYITDITYANGDELKVYADTPVTATTDNPAADPSSATDAGPGTTGQGITVTPVNTPDKSIWAPPAHLMSAADELVALGVTPAEATEVDDTPPGSGSGGASPNITEIKQPLCVNKSYDNNKLHISGCDHTYRVGTNGAVWYLEDKDISSGIMHDTNCAPWSCDEITGLKFGHQYPKGNSIVDWNPSDTYGVGSCHTVTVSVSYQGSGISDSSQWCPETFGVYGKGATYYSVKWDGQGYGPHDGARAAHSVDAVYNGVSASPWDSIYWYVWWTT